MRTNATGTQYFFGTKCSAEVFCCYYNCYYVLVLVLVFGVAGARVPL